MHQANERVAEASWLKFGACVQVLHFVGHRKKTLQLVHKAFMQGGLQGMYQMLSMLPHSERDYAELDIPALEQYLLPKISPAA